MTCGFWIASVLFTALLCTMVEYSDTAHPRDLGEAVSSEDIRASLQNMHDNRHTYGGISNGQRSGILEQDYSRSGQEKLDFLSDPRAFLANNFLDDIPATDWSQFLDYISRATQSDARENDYHKRQGHSLSIVNPLDVLRQRLLLENARRRMKENQEQIKANEVYLKSLGKRSVKQTLEQEKGFNKRSAQSGRRRFHRSEFVDRPQDSSTEDFDV